MISGLACSCSRLPPKLTEIYYTLFLRRSEFYIRTGIITRNRCSTGTSKAQRSMSQGMVVGQSAIALVVRCTASHPRRLLVRHRHRHQDRVLHRHRHPQPQPVKNGRWVRTATEQLRSSKVICVWITTTVCGHRRRSRTRQAKCEVEIVARVEANE